MNRRRIIIASPHVWNAPYKVGSHQYATCFSDNQWKVAYVSVPITPFHVVYHFVSSKRAKLQLSTRWKSWVNGGEQIGNIWTYVPFGFIPIASQFIFDSRWAIENAGKFLIPPLRKKLQENAFDSVNVIWLDSPLFGYLLEMVPHGKSVLRVADDLSGFPELGRNVIEAEKELAKKVDLVVVTCASLERKVRDIGAKNILHLPNGVDFDHFANDMSPEPEDLRRIPGPRIIYVGSIERWFDEGLLAHAAGRREDISFVIVGSYKKGMFPELESLRNVFFLGKRDYARIPSYLKHSHVGIIPFKRVPFVDSVNPIKLYEYMACGLPVVSTKWITLEEIASPSLLAETKVEFLQNINHALDLRGDIKDACIEYARKNSWTNRFELLNKYL